ncbi:hypothetical protein D3C75_683470 [compost metagenome]
MGFVRALAARATIGAGIGTFCGCCRLVQHTVGAIAGEHQQHITAITGLQEVAADATADALFVHADGANCGARESVGGNLELRDELDRFAGIGHGHRAQVGDQHSLFLRCTTEHTFERETGFGIGRVHGHDLQVHGVVDTPVNEAPALDISRGNALEGRLHHAVDAGEPTALIPDSGRGELRIEVLYHTCFAAGTRPGAILLRNDGALVVETGIRDLLEQKDLFGNGLPGSILENGVDVAWIATGVGAVATHNQGARGTAGYLQRRGTMPVRVVPEGARRVIGGDVDLVFEFGLWRDVQQHVVAVARRRDVHPVVMQIDRIKATSPTIRRIASPRTAGIVFLQLVVQVHSQGVAWLHIDERPRQAAAIGT